MDIEKVDKNLNNFANGCLDNVSMKNNSETFKG